MSAGGMNRLMVVLLGCLAVFVPQGCPLPPISNPDNPAGIALQRILPEAYYAGDDLVVTIRVTAEDAGSISAIGVTEVLPAGWEFVSTDGAPIAPPAGAAGTIDFAWIAPPTFPIEFMYVVRPPFEAAGSALFSGSVTYREGAGPHTVGAVVSTISPANPAGVSLERTHGTAYTPGGVFTVDIAIDADAPAAISALGVSETIPEGWSLRAVSGEGGDAPEVFPAPGRQGVLDFAWIDLPAFPVHFRYTLDVPEDAAGPVSISGYAAYRRNSGPLGTELLVSEIEASHR